MKALSLLFLLIVISNVGAAEGNLFSAQAEALPFPPDARGVEFDATFGDVEFTSGSSLAALTKFYRRELIKRGWTEDSSAAEIEDDSVELTFQHEGAQIVLELDEGSDEVDVSFDCEGLDFANASDPAELVAAGVPQPRSYVFLQKSLPRPVDIQDVRYRSDVCHFKSKLGLQAAFDFYMSALTKAGWRETRKPIITDDRRYTEFKKGTDEVSVNIFADPVGSRIILTDETEIKPPTVPPLPNEGGELLGGLAESNNKDKKLTVPSLRPRVDVDVTKNTGSATFTLGGKKYAFKYVAAYQEKQDLASAVADRPAAIRLLFTDGPIPFARMQELLHTEDTLMMSDLYPQTWPGHLMINTGQYPSFTFNVGGTGIGNGIDKPENTLKLDQGRVRGTIRMAEPQEAFDEKYQLEATIDAAVLTPETQLTSAK